MDPSASFIWKYFLWGRELLQKGVRWRMGNGEGIRVFHDTWVPGLVDFSMSWKLGLDSHMRVCDLINASGEWNIDLLERIGTVHERDAFLLFLLFVLRLRIVKFGITIEAVGTLLKAVIG